jgi:hypothetical protein
MYSNLGPVGFLIATQQLVSVPVPLLQRYPLRPLPDWVPPWDTRWPEPRSSRTVWRILHSRTTRSLPQLLGTLELTRQSPLRALEATQENQNDDDNQHQS